jgi:Rrf2 family protein
VLRLNKKTEYALLALRMLDRPDRPDRTDSIASGDRDEPADALVTAKAIAQRYQLPEMLLAKVLQRMKKRGLVVAAKGSGGGYRLARPLAQIPLMAILELFDEQMSLVECQGETSQCQQGASCDIKGPLAVLNAAVMEPLRKMSIADLFGAPRREPAKRFAIIQA